MSSSFPIPRQLRSQDFLAVAAQTVFDVVDFKVYDPLDLRVRVKPVGSTLYTVVETGFVVTLTGPAPAYAKVPWGAGRAAGDVVRVEGARLASRTTDVTAGGTLRSASLEAELDRVVITLQEQRRDIDRRSPDLIEGDIDRAETAANAAVAARDVAITARDQVIAGLDNRATKDFDNVVPATGRTALGLGDAATKNVGSGAGTVMAGDDARIANMPTARFKGRLSAGAGAMEDLTVAQMATALKGTGANTLAAGDDARLDTVNGKTGGTVSTDTTINGSFHSKWSGYRPNQDMNALTDRQGDFTVYNPTNGPSGAGADGQTWQARIVVNASDPGTVFQQMRRSDSLGQSWLRRRLGGTFGAWVQDLNGSNIAADATIADKVSKTAAETIGGAKTFSLPVVVPNASAADHAVAKGQLDTVEAAKANRAGDSFTGAVKAPVFQFPKPASGTVLGGDVHADLSGNTLRFYEGVAPFRGVLVNLSTAGTQSILWHDGNLSPATLNTAQTITGGKNFTGTLQKGGVTVATVDDVAAVAVGVLNKYTVRAATTAAITLSGAQTVDGVALVAGETCLVKNQAAPADHGIYVVAAGAWARATNMDAWSEVYGASVFVTAGTANGSTNWGTTAPSSGTLGTTAIPWVQQGAPGSYTADEATLTKSGSQFAQKDGGTSNAKLAPVASGTLKGRTTAGTGAPEDLTLAQVATALAGTVANTLAAGDDVRITGAVQKTGNETIAGNKTFSLPVAIPDGSAASHAASKGQLDAATGNNSATNARLADVPTATLKGRATAGTGDPEDLTATQVRTLLGVQEGAQVNPPIASKADAEAGLNNTDMMTALRTQDAIKAATVILDLYAAVQPASKFGAPGDGTNQTGALNTAFQKLFEEARGQRLLMNGAYKLSYTATENGVKYCVKTRGIGVEGTSMGSMLIFPDTTLLAGTHDDVDYFYVRPDPGTEAFLSMSNMFFYPNIYGAPRGARCILIETPPTSALANLELRRIYCQKGNGQSIVLYHAGTVQGAPVLGLFEDLNLYEGLKGTGLGDSNKFRGGTYRRHNTAEAAIDLHFINAGGGAAGGQYFENINGGGTGTVMRLRNGRLITIINPNLELGNDDGATGGPNRCVLDIDGVDGVIEDVLVQGGVFATFPPLVPVLGTDIDRLIRVDKAKNVRLERNNLAQGGPIVNEAILITNQAERVDIAGPTGALSSFSVIVNDSGKGTGGLFKAVSWLNGFANVVSDYAPLRYVRQGNVVTFTGGLRSPASPGANTAMNTAFGEGFRPNVKTRLQPAAGIVIDIETTGVMTWVSGAGATDVDMSRCSYRLDTLLA